MAERSTILWEHPRGVLTRAEKEQGLGVISDLQIDRAFRLICPDPMLREAFLSVIATPLTDAAEIAERQKIIAFFRDNPALLSKLIDLVRRIAVTKNAWDAERSRLLQSRNINPTDKSMVLWSARGTLVLTAHYFRIFIGCIREMHEALNMFGCAEGWLGRLKDRLFAVGCTQDTAELIGFADKIEKHLENAHTYEIEFDFDGELRMSPVFLREFRFIQTVKKEQKKPKNPLLALFDKSEKNAKKPEEKKPAEEEPLLQVSLGSTGVDWGLETAAKAVNECDRYLTGFIRTLIDTFDDLEWELYFYKAVLMHIERLRERNVEVIFPAVLPCGENVLEMEELSDLLLLTESMSVLSVVPNHVHIGGSDGTEGILVTGKNNSGKTVYLRSVGTAVLLAQCGLPIPAKKAVIGARSRIFTTFAKSEGELEAGSSAGRFEEEVAEISAIIDRIVPNSLVLLNETFQTTSYDEGSDGMADILEYFSFLGCGYIFVTHLTKLKNIIRENGSAEILKTSDDPRN
ncbi:MAG: hypothetical protein IKI93_08040, partial [Clostridia bacterium]|nr:hypothetical protein [Clostridia bacterium]